MPNARREGWSVSTYSAPTELIAAAREKVAREKAAGNKEATVSAVIRAALEDFTA